MFTARATYDVIIPVMGYCYGFIAMFMVLVCVMVMDMFSVMVIIIIIIIVRVMVIWSGLRCREYRNSI